MARASPTVTLLLLGLSVISLVLAITQPLVSVAGYYDLHLFPDNDRFDYKVSNTHRASQAMHVLALVSLGTALLVLIVSHFTSWPDSTFRKMSAIQRTATVFGTAFYLAGVATLLKIAMDYKHIADDLPVAPNGSIEAGGILDIIGFASAFVSCMFVFFSTSRDNTDEYQRL
ncbi:hypothetical protein HK099_002967, partial [Clydaea vesicula]